MRITWVLPTAAAVVLVVAGCGGGKVASISNAQAEQTAHDIITENAKELPEAERPTVNDVRCVKETTGRWSCLVDVTLSGEKESFGITMTCDESGYCITKPD